jgi:dienelactone hydrolase
VYAALDPDALPPGLVGTRAAIYVIRHKTAAQWAASNSLTDVSGPGMTSAVKVVPIVPGCVNWNTTLVWPNPQVPGKYDIVIDFGNNVADPAQFTSDGQLDATLDMIDGNVRVGFSVTDDPSLPGPFATIGQHDYAMATIDVPSTDTGPTPTTALPITATVRYPAQSAGIDAPVAAGAFPLVIVMHGNSGMETSYRGYDYLLSHLASWGFIAASIYAPVGAGIETRARAILAHLGVMTQENADPGLFHGHIDLSHLGIAGHSRGGEAVIRAARINIAEALGWNIQAGISIAPTDYFHYGDPGIPLLVIYGANDGDVSGAWPDRTGFDIYDEAGRPRSFAFVYGATHDRFNTEWASIEASTELTWDIEPSDIANLISVTDHQNVAKAYVAAFLRAHLLGQSEQLEYFSSALTPSLLDGLNVHLSHQLASTVLDDFNNHNPALNALGAVVAATALPTFAEDSLRALDPHSPHVVAGANVAWQTSSGIYLSNVPIASRDLSGFDTLSFRVAQKYESVQNPPGALLDFDVRLIDRNGKSRAIRVSTFADIPYPYVRADDNLVKSALKTVRIPLASYTIANLGAQDVDLTNVASISFEFDRQATGEIDIADLEFGP